MRAVRAGSIQKPETRQEFLKLLNKHSQKGLAKILGCSRITLNNWQKEFDIESQTVYK